MQQGREALFGYFAGQILETLPREVRAQLMRIALLPRAVAEVDGRLVRLETESAPKPRVIWQAVHRDLQRSARVRAVLEFLAEVLSAPAPE